VAYCEPVASPGAMSVAIEKLLQEETASRACYSMAGCFYVRPAWAHSNG